jgi:AcrR family transcriptional regulator
MSEKDPGQELILNAAKACYLRLGVAKTTAADIAQEAGVSRATLYRRFPSHNDIFLAVLARESWEMFEACDKKLRGIDDPSEHMIEGILFVLDEIVRRPLHAHLFTESDGSWVLSQTMAADNLHEMCVQMLSAMPGIQPVIDEQDRKRIEYMGEWVLRILASYALTPSHLARNRDEMRALLTTTLEPAVRALIAPMTRTSGKVKPIR